MESTDKPAIYKLPDELLLQITTNLGGNLSHLRNLCLVSKKLYLITQDEFYANAILPVSCGCHPSINAAVQLLRTLIERPELAVKVKALRFSIVRRSVAQLYSSKGFQLPEVRQECLSRLSKLGFNEDHLWWTSVSNDVESAYGGVLLTMLPNLLKLDFFVKDHQRGIMTQEPISALVGTYALPRAMSTALQNVQSLTCADLALLRAAKFATLKVLDLKHANVGTLLRLNGPNSLHGTKQLEELSIGASVQFLDKLYLNELTVHLADLLAALGCGTLKKFSMMLSNNAYCLDQEPDFHIGYLMSQLAYVSSTLRVLEIDFDPDEPGEMWEWLLSRCVDPIESLRGFPELTRLRIPQEFLFDDFEESTHVLLPEDLPPKLQHLQIVAPTLDIDEWVRKFLSVPDSVRNMRTITLYCRDDANSSASAFQEHVDGVWVELQESLGIQSFVVDQTNGEEESLPLLCEASLTSSEGEDDDDMDLDSDWEGDEDDDVPDLEDPKDINEDDGMAPVVDDVD